MSPRRAKRRPSAQRWQQHAGWGYVMNDDTLPRATSPAMKNHLIAWCILLGITCAFAWVTWQGWGHPIIDLGREVYVPSQLREGRLLYRDIAYNYGPIAPYAAAALTAIFGDTLAVHAWWGAAIGLATMAGLYALGCFLGVRSVGFAAALLFVLFSFFAQSTFGCNYILPYAQAATLSMAMAIWSLHQLMVYLYRGHSRRSLYLGAGLMIAAIFTKQEVGVAIALTWLIAAWAHRVAVRDALFVAIASIVAAGLFTAIFGKVGWQEMTRLIGASSADEFSGNVSGANTWQNSLLLTAFGAAVVIAVMVLASQARRNMFWTVAAVIGIAIALRFGDSFVFRAALPLAIGAAVWCVMTGRRRDPLLLIAVLSVACALRVLLRFEPSWYGFYLYVPAYLLMVYGLGAWLSPRLGRQGTVLAALVVLTLVVAGRFNFHTLAVNDGKRDTLVTSRGVMRDIMPGRAEAIGDCLQYLRDHAPPGATLVVLPEGVTLNWFSGLPNPMTYYSFIPPELTDGGVEQRMVAQLKLTKPTYVVITARSLKEFVADTPDDYMPQVMAVVDREYGLVSTFGQPGKNQWRLVLLARRENLSR